MMINVEKQRENAQAILDCIEPCSSNGGEFVGYQIKESCRYMGLSEAYELAVFTRDVIDSGGMQKLNSHDDLVAALRLADRDLREYYWKSGSRDAANTLNSIQAALAKAEGGK